MCDGLFDTEIPEKAAQEFKLIKAISKIADTERGLVMATILYVCK